MRSFSYSHSILSSQAWPGATKRYPTRAAMRLDGPEPVSAHGGGRVTSGLRGPHPQLDGETGSAGNGDERIEAEYSRPADLPPRASL